MPELLLPSLCLSGDGSCHYGDILQRKDFRNYRLFHPAGTFWYRLALSGRRKQTAVDFGNYLCSAVLTLLCYIYSRCEPFDTENLPTTKLTFYAILFGLSVYIVRLNFCTELQIIPSAWLWADVLTLAILPTAVSLICTALAIHYIGSTSTAILGALEPVTALFSVFSCFTKTDSPVNGRYFNDYHRCYLDYHR